MGLWNKIRKKGCRRSEETKNKKQKKQKKTYLLSAVGKGDNEENPKMAEDWKKGGGRANLL